MNTRFLTVLVLVVSLVLVLALAASAQGPEPSRPEVQPTPVPSEPSGDFTPQKINAPAVALGQPGLSFRYVQTFGYTETAWLEDTSHLNFPYGVGVDGNNVWIADQFGLRALKFSNSGAFAQQIGKAGFRDATGQSINQLRDVAVDGSSNIWLVDSSVHHLLKFNSSGAYVSKLGQSFSAGSDNSHFRNPQGVAFDTAGNIYVSDGNNHRVQVFKSSGVYSTTIGITGVPTSTNAGFNTPRHIAIDSNNLLYVTDANNNRVQIFNVSSLSAISYVATIGTGVAGSGNNQFNFPSGVHVDTSKFYVVDQGNHRVQIFDRTTRAYQATLGTGAPGTLNTQFNFPADVVVDLAGNIYVADQNNHRMQQFDSSLNYVRTYGTTGVPYVTDSYHYNRPIGIAVAADGSVYFAEERGHRLIKLNAAGMPQWVVGEAGVSGSDNLHLNFPQDVALDGAGNVYVADSSNNRIQIFTPDGVYSATLSTGFGSGNTQFNFPRGLFITADSLIYIADQNNHRVQIFDGSRNYVATLGVTGVSSTTTGYFNQPADVVVDSNGNIYVSELGGTHRVQIFNSNRVYQRTLGGAASCTSASLFDEFCRPTKLAVDTGNNIYIVSQSQDRVDVFDPSGAYLTSIGHNYSNRPGQLRDVDGIALDNAGNLYLADYNNMRIQKYAPGVPGWKQVNINGFGDRRNQLVTTLSGFGGQLYAGTYNPGSGNGAQIWRTADGTTWTPVMTNGFGITRNVSIDHLFAFNGQLYASTWADAVNGGEVWRSSDGMNWSRVVSAGFGDTTNGEVFRLTVFNNTLYASTWSYTNTHGTEVWRSSTGNAGDWTRAVANGFNSDVNNLSVLSFESFNGYLYAGTANTTTGGEVWRTNDGTTWSQANADGFGTVNNPNVPALAAFNGYLYASTMGKSGVNGATVWRCQVCDGSDWTKVVDNGFGDINTRTNGALAILAGRLYFVVGNSTTGMEVWRTTDGANWEQVGFAGLGDSNNNASYWDNSTTVLNGHLYVGTSNSANGGEVWEFLHLNTYLPLLVR